MNEFYLDDKFLFGVATASTQIEGGETNSNWNHWYRMGKIKDGSNPARANDHYHRFREDIDLLASLGIQTYRFSVEWSRLEPQQGEFNQEAFSHYKEEIEYLLSKGILPLLTLHHFNNPMWFEELGGFLNKDSPSIFLAFATRVVEELGDLVKEYITINEPNVFATSAYYFGEFYPGKQSIRLAAKCMTNLAAAHIVCYNMIHRVRKEKGHTDTKVGYASHLRVFEPSRKRNVVDVVCCKLMEKMFQGGLDKTALTGKRRFPLGRRREFVAGKYYDFVGINYYSRSMVKGFNEAPKQDAPHNDMGWEIYPSGIKTLAERYYQTYGAPIYITENGTPDREDKFRAQYIYDHLLALSTANAKVERYYYWTFIDNFEWIDGEHERFGLVAINYNTQERTVRKSGYFYRDIIKTHGVNGELVATYLTQKEKHE